jgi:hypothetical protein
MPFVKRTPANPDGDINSLKYHKQVLKQLIRDVTLSGNRRFLAEMILMWISSTGRKKEVIESIILGTNFSKFLDARGLSVTDREDGLDKDKTNQSGNADQSVLDTIGMIERGNAAV